MKRRIQINSEESRGRAFLMVKDAPLGSFISYQKSNRSLEQNALFHALCQYAARELTFQGREIDYRQWKVLFISGHRIATGGGADIVEGLEGEIVNIREASADMTVERMASLISYVTAFLDINGLEVSLLDRPTAM